MAASSQVVGGAVVVGMLVLGFTAKDELEYLLVQLC